MSKMKPLYAFRTKPGEPLVLEWTEIPTARRIKIPEIEGFEFFRYRVPNTDREPAGNWYIIETRSGMAMGSSCPSIVMAVASAKDNVARVGLAAFKERIEANELAHGISPYYRTEV